MKKRNIFATFLITLATVCMVLGYHILSKDNQFMNLRGEDAYFEMGMVDRGFEPSEQYDEHSGILSDGHNEFFYLSHGEALGDRELHLQAKDDKTPAVFCNKTVINGIVSVKAVFSDGPLYAIATSTFFERSEYDASDLLTSGVEKTFTGDDLGYLLILSPSLDVIVLTDVIVKYHCEHNTDKSFFYAPGENRVTGARSWGVNSTMSHDYVQFTTDPNPYNNNYSPGKTEPHENNDSWYRWNGVSLRNHYLHGEEKEWRYDGLPFGEFSSSNFEVICSVIVEPRIFYDETAWFSVSPWVALNQENNVRFPGGEPMYMQSHIGNDNYDPLGLGGVAGRSDTYEGRFYTTFSYGGGGYTGAYGFVDPDVGTLVDDSETTLREAYLATTLPFFHVRFVVDGNEYYIYINGLKVLHEEEVFYDDADYVDQKYTIDNIVLHGVNYGLKDGTAGTIESVYDPYHLTYLNPVVRDLS